MPLEDELLELALEIVPEADNFIVLREGLEYYGPDGDKLNSGQ